MPSTIGLNEHGSFVGIRGVGVTLDTVDAMVRLMRVGRFASSEMGGFDWELPGIEEAALEKFR